jgi:hypothetical protein
MSGTQEGSIKAVKTIYKRHGADFFVRAGKLGGSAKVKKGFAVSGLASSAGRKGGTISRRGKNTIWKVYAPTPQKPKKHWWKLW